MAFGARGKGDGPGTDGIGVLSHYNFVISTEVRGRNYLLSSAKNLIHLTVPPATSTCLAYKFSPYGRNDKVFYVVADKVVPSFAVNQKFRPC